MNLVLLLTVVVVLIVSFDVIMRRWLKVKRESLFLYHHVNNKHKKIDWSIRTFVIVMIIIGYILNIQRDYMDRMWFFETWFIILIFIFLSGTTQAYMEWKYAENRNAYRLTLSQLAFATILFVLIYKTNFFGLVG
nr:DUF4181 domain-containing protein [Halalkalibacter alkaliphilus]